ncbi:glycosyltransferase family 4 protein [Jatrophihabitans sp. YIM 134969]
MKVAMISQYLPGGSKIGVGHQVHVLAEALVDRGHEVTVFSACEAGPGARYRTEVVRLGGALRTFRFAAAMRRVDFTAFDVLHAHGDDYLLTGRPRPTHIRTLHGSCFDEALHIHGFLARLRMFVLGLSEVLATFVADTTVVVSPATRRWTPWVRRVVPNGVDPAVFSPPAGGRAGVPTVLFVGTYHQRKRGALLMQEFADRVLPAVPDAELWMVCTDAPDAPGVVRWGRVDTDALAELYRRAWVFCLPSSYEGFGIPYAEAIASGTPVVATRNVGARFVLDDGRAGRICDDRDLGAVLVDLLTDDAARESLGAAGLERSRLFDLRRVVDRYEELYRTTTSPRAGG